MDNMFSQYYQQTTYKNDYKKSPRGQPTYGDSSPRGGYYPDAPRGDQRHFREAPREHIDRRYEEGPPRQQIQPGETLFVEPNRSPHHSPRSPRRGYDGFSPAPAGPPINPRGYQYYDRSREDLPPFNTYAINSTTQHDYGDFTQKQQIVNDIRARADAELARRYEKQYDGRPYFDEKDPPSFYRDLPLTDRPGYDMGRRAPKYDDGPLTDRSERNRRPPSLDHRSPPPPARNAFEDMSRGQMKKELDRIELHDGNFKPYSHHNSGGGELQMVSGHIAHHKRLYERPPTKGPGVLSRSIPHHEHRYEDDLMKTSSPRRSQDVEGAGVGVFLLIRTDYGGYDDVKKAFERCSGETPERKLLGYASSDMIDVKEGGNGWKRQSFVSRWNGKNLEQERRGDVDKMMVINWFQGPNQAREWVDRNPEFKHSHLPMPYGNQTSVLPLKYRPSSGYRTFMLMEFNNISKRNSQELHGYIDFMCNELKRYRADVAFIDTEPKTLKSSLFSPSSHILCHMFCDRKEADRFFNDVISRSRFKHADVTTMVFQLVDFD